MAGSAGSSMGGTWLTVTSAGGPTFGADGHVHHYGHGWPDVACSPCGWPKKIVVEHGGCIITIQAAMAGEREAEKDSGNEVVPASPSL